MGEITIARQRRRGLWSLCHSAIPWHELWRLAEVTNVRLGWLLFGDAFVVVDARSIGELHAKLDQLLAERVGAPS